MVFISGVFFELLVVFIVNGLMFSRKVIIEWQLCRVGIYNLVSVFYYRVKVIYREKKEEIYNIEVNYVELEYIIYMVDLVYYRVSYIQSRERYYKVVIMLF